MTSNWSFKPARSGGLALDRARDPQNLYLYLFHLEIQREDCALSTGQWQGVIGGCLDWILSCAGLSAVTRAALGAFPCLTGSVRNAWEYDLPSHYTHCACGCLFPLRPRGLKSSLSFSMDGVNFRKESRQSGCQQHWIAPLISQMMFVSNTQGRCIFACHLELILSEPRWPQGFGHVPHTGKVGVIANC